MYPLCKDCLSYSDSSVKGLGKCNKLQDENRMASLVDVDSQACPFFVDRKDKNGKKRLPKV